MVIFSIREEILLMNAIVDDCRKSKAMRSRRRIDARVLAAG